jgi:hypothetical protein
MFYGRNNGTAGVTGLKRRGADLLAARAGRAGTRFERPHKTEMYNSTDPEGEAGSGGHHWDVFGA